MKNTQLFKILEKKMHDWHTEYQIGFKGKSYKCIRNARYPKLEGVKLTECERYELGELLEKDFLNDCI